MTPENESKTEPELDYESIDCGEPFYQQPKLKPSVEQITCPDCGEKYPKFFPSFVVRLRNGKEVVAKASLGCKWCQINRIGKFMSFKDRQTKAREELEQRILVLLQEGKNYLQIKEELKVSFTTISKVKNYKKPSEPTVPTEPTDNCIANIPTDESH